MQQQANEKGGLQEARSSNSDYKSRHKQHSGPESQSVASSARLLASGAKISDFDLACVANLANVLGNNAINNLINEERLPLADSLPTFSPPGETGLPIPECPTDFPIYD